MKHSFQQWLGGTTHDGNRNASTAERLSLPHAEALVTRVAESLADRMNVAGDGAIDHDQLVLARHALNAALEALDSEPALAAELLPSTAAAIRAQIARGCVAEYGLETLGYLVAEIDRGVWEQLVHADQRTVPVESMEPGEAADRRREIVNELGIDETDLRRYRRDLRVEMMTREPVAGRTN